jgi:hypothetical protein
MKKFISILICLTLSFVITGCGTTKQVDLNQMAQAYYGQQRTYKVVKLTNANKINIEGDNMNFEISAPVQPLTIIPRDKGFLQTTAEKLPAAVLMGMGLHAMKEVATSPSVVYPETHIIEQPAPIIVTE